MTSKRLIKNKIITDEILEKIPIETCKTLILNTCQTENEKMANKTKRNILSAMQRGCLSKLCIIRSFQLSNCIVRELPDIIPYNCRLRKLHLVQTGLESKDAIRIARTLSVGSSALEVLNLSSNRGISDGVEEFAAMLIVNSSLRKIDLSKTKLKFDEIFFDSISYNKTLVSLKLQNVKLQSCFHLGIRRMLEKNKVLRSLILSNNKIDDAALRHISEGVAHNTTLLELDLSSTEINDINCLITAIRTSGVLKDLKLNNLSFIPSTDFEALVSAGSSLNSLSIMCTNIRSELVLSLAAGLRSNTSLVSLNLQRNYLNAIEMGLIVDALLTNTTLQYIFFPKEICNDEENDLFWKKLATLISVNETLTHIHVPYYSMTEDALSLIIEPLQYNITIENMGLNCVPFFPVGIEAINIVSKICHRNIRNKRIIKPTLFELLLQRPTTFTGRRKRQLE